MRFNPEILSAYLDGEVSADQAAAIESALEKNPNLQAELEQLMRDDALAKSEFQAILDEPTPLALAAAIKDAPEASTPTAQVTSREWPRRWLMAASFAFAIILAGLGGYWSGYSQSQPEGANPLWLASIAEYHAVYASQQRHLVEVSADEQDHLTTWLSNTIGADFTVPDLSQHGLTFEGGRLLVAAGKPVAQLMYTDASGAVVAVCLLRSEGDDSAIETRQIGTHEFQSWKSRNRNIVVIGDEARNDLDQIAQSARQTI